MSRQAWHFVFDHMASSLYSPILDIDEEPAAKKPRVVDKSLGSDGEEDGMGEVLYGSELVVYDKHRRCQLTEGEYELALHDLSTKQNTPKKQATWETIMDGKVSVHCYFTWGI